MPDLLQAAVNSSSCYTEARNAFILTYRKANFYIEGPLVGKNSSGIYEFAKQTVRISKFQAIEDTLRIFGDLVHFLDISFSQINETSKKSIIEFINDNCTESLTQLHLKNCDGLTLNEFEKPFYKVKRTSFLSSSNPSNVKSKILIKLDQVFPELRSLNLKIVNVDDWSLIGNEFPNLRNLYIDLPEPTDEIYPDLGSLFKKSQKINSLQINYISLGMLKEANNFLLDLRKLDILVDIFDDSYDGDQIHFSNVTHLHLYSAHNNPQVPAKIVFTQLHELYLNIKESFTDEWIKFFENQQKKTIYVCQLNFGDLNNKQLITIAEKQPNIQWATINPGNATNLTVDAIVTFIEKSKKLSLLEFSRDSVNVAERAILQDKLSRYWTISTGKV